MRNALIFEIEDVDGEGSTLQIIPECLVIAGWAGRNKEAVQHHIDELAAIGVAPPSATPLFYRVSANLIDQAPDVTVLGSQSSGEVEPLLLCLDGKRYVGLGSDHTDRHTEGWSVAHSKQMCPKPLASAMWRWEDVSSHWDDVRLRSWIRNSSHEEWQPYQNGGVRDLINPIDLADLVGDAGNGLLMLCGTLSVIGAIRPAAHFRMQIEDPVLDRRIEHTYKSQVLAVAV
jgi:Protein of unknown function (DUF2848)